MGGSLGRKLRRGVPRSREEWAKTFGQSLGAALWTYEKEFVRPELFKLWRPVWLLLALQLVEIGMAGLYWWRHRG